MIRITVFITLLVVSFTTKAISQSKYEQGMTKAFELWQADKPFEATNLFERIASVEPEEWHPHYYIAMTNTTSAFGLKDKEKLTLQLEKAKKHIEEAELISPDNPEIIIIKAMINTAWISFDGATYGMTLSMKNTELYKKAAELAPDNPRVVLSKAEWDMGSARFFGGSVEPYCKDVERAIELFVNFKAESGFAPKWGMKRAEQIVANCKK